MRLKELIEFNAAEYARRISTTGTGQLQLEDKKKLKRIVTSSAGLGSATVDFILTGGAGILIGGPLSWRALWVAKQKSNLIRTELTDRGAPLCELTKGEIAWNASTAVVAAEVFDAISSDIVSGLDIPLSTDGGEIAEQVVAEAAQGLSEYAAGAVSSKIPHPAEYLESKHSCKVCFQLFDLSASPYMHCDTCSASDFFAVCQNCALDELNVHPKSHVFCMVSPFDYHD